MKFFHYQSIDNLDRDLEFIKNGKIWFSNFKNLNDPSEGLLKIKLKIDFLKRFHFSNAAGIDFDKHMSRIYYETEIEIDAMKKIIGIYCLTESVDSELMWSYYSSGHSGLCLEYELNKIEEFGINQVVSFPDFEINDIELVKVQKVKTSVAGSMETNLRLEKLADDVKRIYREAHIQGIVPTVQFIRENLPENQRSASVQFFEVFEKFIEMKRSISSKGTITKFKVIKKHLMEFSSKKRIRIEFDSIDKALLQKFVDYQLHDCQHTNNTVTKNVNIIKWFLNWATDEECNRNLKYKGFTLKEKFGKIIVLSWEELIHFYQMKLASHAMKQVRDIFCFQCFTGLRYSDVRILKKHNVKDGFITITTVKTKEEINIPLNDYSTSIIEKYKDYPGNYLLPVISNQNMNEHLKELGKMAGFNEQIEIIRYRGAERLVNTVYKYEVLTTHIGRKTFTTNNGRLGIPIELTMQIGWVETI